MCDTEPKQTLSADRGDIHAPDPEVLSRAERRQYTAQYKLRILEEVERCTERRQIDRRIHQRRDHHLDVGQQLH